MTVETMVEAQSRFESAGFTGQLVVAGGLLRNLALPGIGALLPSANRS